MEEIIDYIEKNVFPFYEKQIGKLYADHARRVAAKSLDILKQIDDKSIKPEIVYTAAAYHDMGLVNGKPLHEKLGAQMFLEDTEIKKFFTPEEIKIIAEAIEDHRASNNDEPRSVYGRIVSTADRLGWLDVDEAFKVWHANRLKNMPDASLDEMIEDTRLHVLKKYSTGGYVDGKLYFPDPKNEFEMFRKEVTGLAENPKKFKERYLNVYANVVSATGVEPAKTGF